MSKRNVLRGAGLIVLAKSTGRCLFPLRSSEVAHGDVWGTWGGKVEDGETFEDGAIREFEEESGYKGAFLEVVRLVPWESPRFVYMNHLAVIPQEFTPKLNWETTRAEWLPITEAPEPQHFGLDMLLRNAWVREEIRRRSLASRGERR